MNWKMFNPKDVAFKQTFRNLIALLCLAMVLLAGCQGQSILDVLFPPEDISNPLPSGQSKDSGQTSPTLEATATTPASYQLEVWIPPQFNPYEDSDAAQLLSEQFKSFLVQNPQVNLDIRVKAASGQGSIIDTLTYASQVAPDALPSLVLLSRSDLETAAEKGLIQPIESFSSEIDDSDWYDFARDMGIVQGTVYGLPFAADALGLVYHNMSLTSNQPSWNDLQVLSNSLIFPAADQTVLATLGLYFSANGTIQNAQGQPALDTNALTTTLSAYSNGLAAGILSPNLLDLQNDDQAWDKFHVSNADAIITWASRQLQSDENLRLALLPTLGVNSVTLAKGWVWCIPEINKEKEQYAISLAQHLSNPDFLIKWNRVSGYLPVRLSSISAWENPVTQDTLTKMLLSARLRPNTSQISSLTAVIKTAIQEVMLGQSSATVSAQNAVESLEALEPQ
jgi:multiple sugar transport system substrate-binding protein